MKLFRACSCFLRCLALVVFGAVPSTVWAGTAGFAPLKTLDQSGGEPLAPLVEGPGGYLYGGTYQGGVNATGTLFKVRKDGTGYAVLHTFGPSSGQDGNLPYSMIVGSDGALYGITDQGGASHVGTIFKIQPDGTGYVKLHTFVTTTTNGSRPQVAPVEGPGGKLYGMTYAGGTANLGTVYSIDRDGANFTILHSFAGGAADGASPFNGLTVANDGKLYGVTQLGGATNVGTIFRLNPDGSGYTVLRSFVVGSGTTPRRSMIQATDGALYGTTGGTGVLFKINLDGSGYTVLMSFSGIGDANSGVMQAADGKLYGTTIDGGTSGRGSVFRVNLDGTGFTTIRSFTGGTTDGHYAGSPVIQGSDGALYGATRFGGPQLFMGSLGNGTIFKVNPDGTGSATLLLFSAQSADGSTPLDGFIQGSDGALYGTASQGGTSNNGVVLKIQPDGTGFTVLHHFAGGASDGATSNDGVMEATDGRLYGVTYAGGTSSLGTLYRMQRDGTGFAVIHHFAGGTADGSRPRGRVIQGSDGALYGTTSLGGASSNGVVYRVNPDGTGFTLLYSFGPAPDGAHPSAGVIEGSDGVLYGTTQDGGTYGIGTVFRIQRNGGGYAVLHGFDGASGAREPRGRLLQGSDGALYGTAFGNVFGNAGDVGALFKLKTDGTGYTVLRCFNAGPYDGALPAAHLIKAANGRLYGAATSGGLYYNDGAIFSLNEDGSGYGVLYSFTGGDYDGFAPTSLVQASNGVYYGMTYGSPSHLGVIFKATLANTAPVANPQTVTVTPGVPMGFTLTGTDADGDPLTYEISSAPLFGLLAGSPPSLSYDPNGFTGTETFQFVAFDGSAYSAEGIVTFNVGVASQTLTFPAIPDHVYGDAPFGVSATASSGLPVTFSVLSGPATIAGTTVTITGVGTVTVQAAQAGNSSFGAVTATRSFQVTPAPATVTLSNLYHLFDGSPKSATVTTLPGGLATTVTYNGSSTAPVTVGYYNVVALVTNPNYAGSATGTLTIAAVPTAQAPAIARQPDGGLLAFGGTVTLTVAATGTSPLSYQWRRDGVIIPGATLDTYQATLPGSYTVVVSNATGNATSNVAVVTTASRLVNISGRVRVGTGDSVLILGLVVGGPAGSTKRFLMRAAGPALVPYGIATPLARPQLEVYQGSTVLASNAGWSTAADPTALAAAMASVGAFPFVSGAADSAALVDLAPGTYSVVVRGADGGTGIALAEVYELDATGGQLLNLSARLDAGIGDNTAIAGFVISGPQPAKVLIRAVGPGLVPYGVPSALAQPRLTVNSSSSVVVTNQGWGTSADPAAAAAGAVAVGAFPLTPGSADCAVVVTLAPGRYSAQVTGVGGTSGVALVEVYQLP